MTHDRLPRNLRRRIAVERQAMTARWATQPDRPDAAHESYYHPLLRQEFCQACGEPWPCLFVRQEAEKQPPPVRCRCSHLVHPNGPCWSVACGCGHSRPQEPKPEVAEAMRRHPAGKGSK